MKKKEIVSIISVDNKPNPNRLVCVPLIVFELRKKRTISVAGAEDNLSLLDLSSHS